MKRCPQCDFRYEDDQPRCVMDGAELVDDPRAVPDVFSPQARPIKQPRRKHFLVYAIYGICWDSRFFSFTVLRDELRHIKRDRRQFSNNLHLFLRQQTLGKSPQEIPHQILQTPAKLSQAKPSEACLVEGGTRESKELRQADLRLLLHPREVTSCRRLIGKTRNRNRNPCHRMDLRKSPE